MFIISEASVKDIPEIIAIAHQTWWSTYADILSEQQIRYMLNTIYDPGKISARILNGEEIYLVVHNNSVCQGFASYGLHSDDPGTFKIHKLYVLPQKQNAGYGRSLIQEIVRRLKQENVPFVDLNVNRHNPAAAFYTKVGFQITREEDTPIGPYWMNDYVMRLELT